MILLQRNTATARGVGAWHLMRVDVRGAVLRAACGKPIADEPVEGHLADDASDALAFLLTALEVWRLAPRRAPAICRRCVFGSGPSGPLRQAGSDFEVFRWSAGRLMQRTSLRTTPRASL